MVKRQRPPKLRVTTGKHNCHNCRSMNRLTGLCQKFLWGVKRNETCDKWRPRR